MKIAEKWLPIIDPERCTACGACVNLCAPACLDIPIDHAVLEHAADCKSEGLCVRVCPQGAIEMGWLPAEGPQSRGQWRTNPAFQATMQRNRVLRRA
jgi:NAD-dependent dihydropyrimidine dehydrogenase PreA subunit